MSSDGSKSTDLLDFGSKRMMLCNGLDHAERRRGRGEEKGKGGKGRERGKEKGKGEVNGSLLYVQLIYGINATDADLIFGQRETACTKRRVLENKIALVGWLVGWLVGAVTGLRADVWRVLVESGASSEDPMDKISEKSARRECTLARMA